MTTNQDIGLALVQNRGPVSGYFSSDVGADDFLLSRSIVDTQRLFSSISLGSESNILEAISFSAQCAMAAHVAR